MTSPLVKAGQASHIRGAFFHLPTQTPASGGGGDQVLATEQGGQRSYHAVLAAIRTARMATFAPTSDITTLPPRGSISDRQPITNQEAMRKHVKYFSPNEVSLRNHFSIRQLSLQLPYQQLLQHLAIHHRRCPT